MAGGSREPCRYVTDADTFHGQGGVVIEMAGDAGEVAAAGGIVIGTADGAEDEHGVLDGAGHGAEFVERPAERHGAGARHAAVGGAQAGDAAAHGRADDGAAGFAADGEADEARGGGGAGTGAGAGGAFFEQPGIHGLAAEPDVIECERAERELGDEHGAGGVETLDDGGIGLRYAIAEGLRAIGGGDVGGVEQILCAPGNAVQRATIAAGGDLAIGLLGLLERMVFGERDDAAQRGIEALEAIEIDAGEPLGGELARMDPAAELGDVGEGDVVIARWAEARKAAGAGTKWSCCGGGGMPGSMGFHCVAGASGGSSATLRGPVRRS